MKDKTFWATYLFLACIVVGFIAVAEQRDECLAELSTLTKE